jgi:dienelactone hydrolase
LAVFEPQRDKETKAFVIWLLFWRFLKHKGTKRQRLLLFGFCFGGF